VDKGSLFWREARPLHFDRVSVSTQHVHFRQNHRTQHTTTLTSQQITLNLLPPHTQLQCVILELFW